MGSIFPCCLPHGKAGGLQILLYQGIAVGYYGFTLDALTLKPSDFCNVEAKNRVNSDTLELLKIPPLTLPAML